MTANRREFAKERPNGTPTTADFDIEGEPLPELA